jgi:hypothetical protein
MHFRENLPAGTGEEAATQMAGPDNSSENNCRNTIG